MMGWNVSLPNLEDLAMKHDHGLGRVAATLAAAVFALGVTSLAGLAASPFEGTWKLTDTKGSPFEVTLSADGSAKGDRSGEKLSGTWKEENGSAVINWSDKWTTKITKMGDVYSKKAYENGKLMGVSSEVQKVK